MFSGYANSAGYETKATNLLKQMHSVRHEARVDEFSLTRMCNLTAKLGNSWYGKQLHSFMVKTGNDIVYWNVDVVSKNAVVVACSREGKVDMAMEIFSNQTGLNDVVYWNTMIAGYAQNGYDKNAIELARGMKRNGFRWNVHTFTKVLNACSSLKCLKLGKELHAR
ncbi:putative tetratricopeptide-like helical domain superfamily [Helianthus annuus]|uniref:Putative pentatricopeptide repeat protein n=1 Tax=Helianthus annuus TaxID=4232 RepID=A0A251UWL8_HELAN|nr:putative tetratricopeptide-like helical domain superfamily [Helianthus annuus]KAJ0580672.1 putative tetratricopeptide-like helical domain superfamily [Helianthus annuus]KAJ0588310.1 putative tetratricopeptide-like helical domain superfamily [Helianthus annuus]KAJ0596623.1 putative tetratricopeptide-like helical domain superfamily [Helianthus annuus]KAJ0757288.1 putative tetratricopeptide-like helical domain superfamily [Helianthus annuus]